MNFVRAHAAGALRDLAGLLGFGLIVYGAWQVYAPAGYLVAGVMLLLAALRLARAAP